MSKDLPTPGDSARHWHLVTAAAGGEMTSHGIYMIRPVTLPADTIAIAECEATACFAAHYQAIGLMNLVQLVAQIGQHLVNDKRTPIDLPGLRR